MKITSIETKEKKESTITNLTNVAQWTNDLLGNYGIEQIWTVNYGGKRIDFSTLKEVRAFEHGLRACEFKESVKDKILKELDKIKKYLEWTSDLESLEYFRGKQKAYENVLSWMK